jgi:hypothetical protein
VERLEPRATPYAFYLSLSLRRGFYMSTTA